MESSSNEGCIILALKALKRDSNLSIRAAAKVYQVVRTTLECRQAGRKSRCDISANSRKLTDLEEKVLVNRILDLDSRGFQPRLEDM